jgi:tryptophan-rich sensory protein
MSAFSSKKQALGLLAWLAVCFIVSAIGAVASVQARSFYGQLVRPEWSPPGSVFGPVWTALFTLMAIAAWLVWRQGGLRANRGALGLFLVQLGFNALWSWLFFAWKLGAWALADIALLWVLIGLTLVAFWQSNRLAALLLVPYLLWVSFAFALNYAMWQFNPYLLG